MWLHLSVYQMLRGCQIVFTALLAATFLGRRLTRWHAGGLSLTVAGILLVGLAGVLGAKEAAPFEASLGLTLAAMALIVVRGSAREHPRWWCSLPFPAPDDDSWPASTHPLHRCRRPSTRCS